jgi:hypothetical protein
MIKLIQRTTDGKYLKSVENDLWVDSQKEAFEMTHRECETAKAALSVYGNDIKEIFNFSKSKPMTIEEVKELRNLLKINNKL